MMMAHDPTPDAPRLSAAARDALESALVTYLANPKDTDHLKSALQRVAIEAREKDVRAEHVLVALKDIWYELPQMRAVTDVDEQHRLLQRVVTLCIREYYAI